MAGSESGDPGGHHDDTSEHLLTETEGEMDYEPDTNDEDEDGGEDYVERLLREHGVEVDEIDEEDEEDDDEDFVPYDDIEVEIEGNGDENEANDPEEAQRTLNHGRQVLQFLQATNLGRLFVMNDDGEYGFRIEEGDDDADFHPRWRRRRRSPPDPDRFPKVPSDEGSQLMNSGLFGSNEAQAVSSEDRNGIGRQKKLARRILDRELAAGSFAKRKVNQRLLAQGMIPSSNADMIIHYEQPVYSGQFSDDGNFFYSVNKDFRVRMYDTSNPYKWRYYKTVDYPFGQWTLTDASLSPDNKYLAYSSIRSTVCLAPTDPNDTGDPYNLDLADLPGRNRQDPNSFFRSRHGGSFGIWSVRFSGDGRELVAGTTGGSIVVYDIESRRPLHRIFGHDEDVNAVCFADKSSPHILYSGSDDTTLKVWDTRSMGDNRAAGAFLGHIEGLTYIDSKGDGRYILSNGKDQSMKLWDLRMVMAPRSYDNVKGKRRVDQTSRFDYRFGGYPEDDWYRDPHDNSLVTFRGHKVLRTLIRCHFSPPGSTNSRYVYTGSEDGKVYVYNMDATLAGTVDVFEATKNTRLPSTLYGMGDWDDMDGSSWRTCVRDASWHPSAPMIVASAWNGYSMMNGTCSVHSWNDGAEEDEAEPKMGLRVNPKLVRDEAFYESPPEPQPRSRAARLRVLRASNVW